MNLDSERFASLSNSEREVLDYIRDHPDTIAKMSIQELADAAYVSTATIMRLCKKLKLNGFNDLKYGIRQKLIQRRQKTDTSLEFHGLLSGRLAEVRQMVESLDMDQVEAVTDLLCGEGNIFLFARGLSYMPMNYMYNVLLSVDRNCILYIDPPLMFNAALQMEEGDVAIIASSGGATREVLKAADMVKDSGAALVVLSSSPDTTLRGCADYFFHCPAQNRRFYEVDIKSRFTIAFMIELLLNNYLGRMNLNPPSDPKVYVDLKNW